MPPEGPRSGRPFPPRTEPPATRHITYIHIQIYVFHDNIRSRHTCWIVASLCALTCRSLRSSRPIQPAFSSAENENCPHTYIHVNIHTMMMMAWRERPTDLQDQLPTTRSQSQTSAQRSLGSDLAGLCERDPALQHASEHQRAQVRATVSLAETLRGRGRGRQQGGQQTTTASQVLRETRSGSRGRGG